MTGVFCNSFVQKIAKHSILKQEMYHGEKVIRYEELKLKVEEYIEWYNHVRSKVKLAGLSPAEYRTQTSQSAV